LNLADLERLAQASVKEVSLEALVAGNWVKGRFDRLVVLGQGELTKAVQVKAHRVSASAQEKIKKAGGSVEILPVPGPQKRAKKVK
jgi:large subunit ribosomal protein L15